MTYARVLDYVGRRLRIPLANTRRRSLRLALLLLATSITEIEEMKK